MFTLYLKDFIYASDSTTEFKMYDKDGKLLKEFFAYDLKKLEDNYRVISWKVKNNAIELMVDKRCKKN